MVARHAAAFALVGVLAFATTTRAATPCADLVPGGASNASASAAEIAAGAFRPAGTAAAAQASIYATLPAFCRYRATLTPTPDSAIGIEVWLPLSGWNGRFQGVGNRGWGGSINYALLANGLAQGYAVAGPDTGHVGGGSTFAIGHPERVIDAGYRAVHEMTVHAKQLVTRFYETAAQRSFWNGCSLGGRQGLMEAQRFPADYDGIVVGDPVNNLIDVYAARVRFSQVVNAPNATPLKASALAVLHDAAVLACDGRDGVKDGVIEHPAACRVDVNALVCKGNSQPCLAPEEAVSARAIYGGVVDARTGTRISGGFEPGSELAWSVVAGPQPENNSLGLFRDVVAGDPAWTTARFDLSSDLERARRVASPVLDATDANLAPFFDRGGKLLMYHGWADPQTPPSNTIAYVGAVASRVGSEKAEANLRLFMVPGMGHCDGGVGTDVFDPVAPLVRWVEQGAKPARIEAARIVDGKTVRTRPLCAYGTIATWDGHGSTDDAASFVCAVPKADESR